MIRVGEAGGIRAAYPFSGVPTVYAVTIDGGPTSCAMCAVDALGMAAMLDRAAAIRSVNASDDSEIRVTVAPQRRHDLGAGDNGGVRRLHQLERPRELGGGHARVGPAGLPAWRCDPRGGGSLLRGDELLRQP